MDVLRIRGGKRLQGEVAVSGAKNATLPIFAATLLTEEPCTIRNVPDLSDVRSMATLLERLGAEVERVDSHTWRIAARNVNSRAPYDLVRRMRASVCLMGPLLGRLRHSSVSLPGGCVIGQRPIDIHLKGFRKLGCSIEIAKGYVEIDGRNMAGADVFLGGRHGSTVLGTANILMAAVLTPGRTRIESAACEPEVVDLCHMLEAMGARISGIGSHALVVDGVDRLHGCDYAVIPDRIEAGTLILASAITEGDVTVTHLRPEHLTALIDKLEGAGLPVTADGDRVRIRSNGQLSPVDVITHPHPGFPTDLQAQITALMSVTPGLSIITEKIYPSRFMHVPELQRMGADIAIEGASAIIKGGNRLSGAPVMASDLRASAALVLAGLAANNDTWIQRIYHLDRGYEKIEDKLQALGAEIERVSDQDIPKNLLDPE